MHQKHSVSLSATLAVLGCRVESPLSDVGHLCFWTLALRLRSRALPYVTVVVACSMAGRGLAQNAQFLVQKQGKLPGGERCGLRHISCALDLETVSARRRSIKNEVLIVTFFVHVHT